MDHSGGLAAAPHCGIVGDHIIIYPLSVLSSVASLQLLTPLPCPQKVSPSYMIMTLFIPYFFWGNSSPLPLFLTDRLWSFDAYLWMVSMKGRILL